MRVFSAVLQIFFLCLLSAGAGCEPAQVTAVEPSPTPDNGFDVSVYSGYMPAKIDIMSLTRFISANDAEDGSKIIAYVSLLDSSASQVKSPGVFRFELYQKVLHSAEPKGKRMIIWPDIDLTDPLENNHYWRDFLRVYKFDLDFQPQPGKAYILQVTCICPDGRRLSAEFALKQAG